MASGVTDAFVRSALGGHPPVRSTLRIVTSSLHGVGDELLGRSLAAAGFDRVHPEPSQRDPDPDFPTVPFPNPEEPGALDRLFALATTTGADLALANDPDADRLAVGVEDDGVWRMLRGDEVGALLGSGLLGADPDPATALLVTTVVSSQLLAKIAAAAGAQFRETLTGFKWLCRPALAEPGLRQLLAYEEALGYAVGPQTRDKDGISAAVAVAFLVDGWASGGLTVRDRLDQLAIDFGAHEQRNFSLRFEGVDARRSIRSTAARVFADPPARLGGSPVTRTQRPAEDVLQLFCANGDRVVIRPSGTEPKLKAYCEAIESVTSSAVAARDAASDRLDLIESELRALFG